MTSTLAGVVVLGVAVTIAVVVVGGQHGWDREPHLYVGTVADQHGYNRYVRTRIGTQAGSFCKQHKRMSLCLDKGVEVWLLHIRRSGVFVCASVRQSSLLGC